MDEKVVKTAFSIKLSKETREAFDKALEMHKREGQTAEEAVKTILGLAGARGITPQAEESLPIISEAVEGLVKAINSVLSERELEATDMAKRLEEAAKMKEEFEKTKTELEQTKKVLKKTQEDAEVLKAEKKAMAQKVEQFEEANAKASKLEVSLALAQAELMKKDAEMQKALVDQKEQYRQEIADLKAQLSVALKK